MMVLAGWANLGVIEHAREASALQLVLAACAMGAVALLDVVVGAGLWILFRAQTPRVARVAMIARVVYAVVLAVAVARLGWSEGDALTRASAFHRVFELGLGVFGVHLIALAGCIAVTRFARGWTRSVLAGLVAIAGAGYLIDALVTALRADVHAKVSEYTFVGEVVLAVWLLWAARANVSREPATERAVTLRT
jgi:hypothetical protein